jgi:Protein of unknown function (DUF3108)
MKRFFTTSLLFIVCQSLQAVQLPNDFDAVYYVEKYGSTIAEMKLALRRKDNIITYESHSRAKGMLALFSDDRVDEISQLEWNQELEHACLQNYQFTRKNKSRKNQQFSLSWDGKNNITAKGTYADKAFNLNESNLIWDRLSVQLALAADLKSGNETQNKYRYNIIDKGKVTQYEFEYIKDEVMRISDRQYNVIQVKRAHASGKRATYLWLARELDFLPVKIDQYRKGELHISMSLNTFTPKQNEL